MMQFQNKRLRNRHLLSSNSNNPAQMPAGLKNSVACAVWICRKIARDAAGSPDLCDEAQYPSRRFRRADRIWALLLLYGAAAASVSGVVRDSAGVPQIGAEVQLLRPDLSVVASVYTDDEGRFLISSLVARPLRAQGDGAFVPACAARERAGSAAPLSSISRSILFTKSSNGFRPSRARRNAQKDDWAWTLRSAANRPLLRWLEDGPLVVVSDGAGSRPKLKARLMATGQAGTFGESGERFSATVEDTPAEQPRVAGARRFCAGQRWRHGIDAGLPAGFGICRLGAVGGGISVEPEVEERGATRAWMRLRCAASRRCILAPDIDAEAGSTAVMARLAWK